MGVFQSLFLVTNYCFKLYKNSKKCSKIKNTEIHFSHDGNDSILISPNRCHVYASYKMRMVSLFQNQNISPEF